MVYAWGLWKKRHERVREQLRQEFREKYREELQGELGQWFDEGRSWEEWLNRESQGNGSKPDKP